jgi:hypothetical protein
MPQEAVKRLLLHVTERVIGGHWQAERLSPLLSQDLQVDEERLCNLADLSLKQVPLACGVTSQVALGYLAEPLAQLFMGDTSTQHFNLHEQVMVEVRSHGRPPGTGAV